MAFAVEIGCTDGVAQLAYINPTPKIDNTGAGRALSGCVNAQCLPICPAVGRPSRAARGASRSAGAASNQFAQLAHKPDMPPDTAGIWPALFSDACCRQGATFRL